MGDRQRDILLSTLKDARQLLLEALAMNEIAIDELEGIKRKKDQPPEQTKLRAIK